MKKISYLLIVTGIIIFSQSCNVKQKYVQITACDKVDSVIYVEMEGADLQWKQVRPAFNMVFKKCREWGYSDFDFPIDEGINQCIEYDQNNRCIYWKKTIICHCKNKINKK